MCMRWWLPRRFTGSLGGKVGFPGKLEGLLVLLVLFDILRRGMSVKGKHIARHTAQTECFLVVVAPKQNSMRILPKRGRAGEETNGIRTTTPCRVRGGHFQRGGHFHQMKSRESADSLVGGGGGGGW